jgi:hypothetical protein
VRGSPSIGVHIRRQLLLLTRWLLENRVHWLVQDEWQGATRLRFTLRGQSAPSCAHCLLAVLVSGAALWTFTGVGLFEFGRMLRGGQVHISVDQPTVIHQIRALQPTRRLPRYDFRRSTGYPRRRWRTTPPKPSSPVPINRKAPGSGTELMFATLTL